MRTKILLVFFFIQSLAFAEFNDCSFNYGREWTSGASLNNLNHVAIWLGDNDFYNEYWEGKMIEEAKKHSLTPVFYAYVIAEYGKDNGLEDCDVGTPNHCTDGANLIRNKWNDILSRYKTYAQGIAQDYGSSKKTIWLIEPDYIQYSVTGSAKSHYNQNGGGIPDADLAGKYFNDIVSTIKQYLPNAQIGVDISPWLNDDLKTWYNLFDKSKINYAFTSGGRTQGNQARIRNDNNNNVTWANVHSWLGKKIIADDGYGIGGGPTNDYQDWMNVSNLNSRIQDGVIAITIKEPSTEFNSFAGSNSNLNTCNGQPPPSSSSVIRSSSSSSIIRSSSSSSIIRSSSSSSIIRSSSSSSIIRSSSSSSIIRSSSSSISQPTGSDWVGENTQISDASNSSVTAGSAQNWDEVRVLQKNLGTVSSGKNYTLSFDATVSSGGAKMDIKVSLAEYCNETLSVDNSENGSSYQCSFTATKNEAVILKITIPKERWESLSIHQLKLDGDLVSPPSSISLNIARHPSSIMLRNGRNLQWNIDASTKVQVFDLQGQRVHQSIGGVDLSSFPAGIYYIHAKGMIKRVQNF